MALKILEHGHVISIDKPNKNTAWQDAVKKEMECMKEFSVFKDIGYGIKIPDSFKNIRVHMIYDVKHDGRHRARFVADGHLTDIPSDSVYSGVVSLCGFRMLLFLAEFHRIET